MRHWLHQRAAVTPQRVALYADDRVWSFAALQDEAARRATVLQRLLADAPHNARVGYLSANEPELYLWLLAGQLAGRQLVLLNVRLAPAELTAQIASAGCGLLLTDADRSAAAAAAAGHLPRRHFEQLSTDVAAADPLPPQEMELDDVCSIMYTSGTTGSPKGVMHSYGNHSWSAIGSMLNLGLEPERDSWICAVPLFHISGLAIMMRGLIYGIPVHLHRRFDAPTVNALLLSGAATTVSVVTSMLRDLLDDLGRRHYPRTLRCLLLGGGSIDDTTLTRCRRLQLPVVFSYGMTETASQVVALSLADVARKPGSAGQPLLPVRVRIDATADGQVGEIQLQSPTLCVGYLNDHERYRAAFSPDGWFRTGDAGRIDAEGFLYVVTRYADLIITGGENVYPAEVENALLAHPAVAQAGVVGRPDPRWGAVPVAFIVTRGEVSDEELLAHCQARLASYKLPRALLRRDRLPTTASGKLQRHLLLTDIEP